MEEQKSREMLTAVARGIEKAGGHMNEGAVALVTATALVEISETLRSIKESGLPG